uniref:Uncharacterized protein n=1 Tax=Physcomitrium patens TaxID=3218 RepID=A0A2K1IJ07_PHYPA|nr:hypothetical protein PHYPA_027953 [Physcomitrium patens]
MEKRGATKTRGPPEKGCKRSEERTLNYIHISIHGHILEEIVVACLHASTDVDIDIDGMWVGLRWCLASSYLGEPRLNRRT